MNALNLTPPAEFQSNPDFPHYFFSLAIHSNYLQNEMGMGRILIKTPHDLFLMRSFLCYAILKGITAYAPSVTVDCVG